MKPRAFRVDSTPCGIPGVPAAGGRCQRLALTDSGEVQEDTYILGPTGLHSSLEDSLSQAIFMLAAESAAKSRLLFI